MAVRAVRGATTACGNEKEDILEATREMVSEIIEKNNLDKEDIIDITFTVTSDLTKAFPALAVRKMGITDVPLIDMAAPEIEDALEKCIRVIVHINSDKKNSDMHHVYLHGARALRPDIVKREND